MNPSRPLVVHPADSIAGPTTPGMEVRHHLDPDGCWVSRSGWIRNEAGDVSDWHDHAVNVLRLDGEPGQVDVGGPEGAGR